MYTDSLLLRIGYRRVFARRETYAWHHRVMRSSGRGRFSRPCSENGLDFDAHRMGLPEARRNSQTFRRYVRPSRRHYEPGLGLV